MVIIVVVTVIAVEITTRRGSCRNGIYGGAVLALLGCSWFEVEGFARWGIPHCSAGGID